MKLTHEEARAEWRKALRSDEFVQGKGYLTQVEGDKLCCCCLGVACEIMRRIEGDDVLERTADKTVSYDKETGLDKELHIYRYGNGYRESAFAPRPVMEWLGLNTDTGDFNESISDVPSETNLVELNDSGKYSFSDIADVIERNPEGLWKTT